MKGKRGIDFDEVKTDEEAKALAKEHHIEYEERHTKGDIINLFFEEYCEKELIQPTFIMDHPLAISPLTKKKPSDPTKVERFELFINTWEMCNAYSELNDPIDQRERFAAQDAAFAALIADQTDLVKFKEIPGQRRGGAERMRRLPDLDLPLDLLIRGIAQIQRLQIHFGNQRQPLTA